MFFRRSPRVRGWSVRRKGLSLANTCPVGSRSGLQCGRSSRWVPALRVVARAASVLWLPLSMKTMSQRLSVGTSCVST